MASAQLVLDDEMEARRPEMIELKLSLQDLIFTDPDVDDVFILRYLISYRNNVPQAEEAIRFACKFRKENASWLRSARDGDRTKAPNHDILKRHMSGGVHKTTIHGAPFLFVRAGLTDSVRLMNTVTEEQMRKFFIYDKEVGFWKCDRLTRESGRLVKMMGVLDFTNVSLFGNDNRFFQAMGDSSKISDRLHPQLVQRMVAINTGAAIQLLWQVGKLFMSERTLAHMSVCTGFDKSVGAEACPFAKQWVKVEDLPTFAGGKCECEGGCIAGIPNDYVGYKIDLVEKREKE